MTTADRCPAGQLRDYPFEPFRGEMPAEMWTMQQDEPVTRVRLPDGRSAWLVLGHAEVCTVLADERFSRIRPEDASPYQTRELNMNGAAHSSVRRLAQRAFTPRRIEAYRPRVQRIVDDLIDVMMAEGPPADVVGGLVVPMPVQTICELLGVPVRDRERFFAWIADLNDIAAYGKPEAVQSRAELRAYLGEQLLVKRANPGEDLLSAWAAEQTAHEFEDDEVIELATGVLLGGLEISSTSAGLCALFQHPHQLARLRAHPDLISNTVDEILRYTAVTSMFRVQTALEDVRLGGVGIPAGDNVMTIPWVANRDPKHFPDPHVFDIDRSPNQHLTFGFGPHYCLGAALGKMEIEIAITTLLRRMPNLAPAIPVEKLPYRESRVNGGIAAFPITW